MNKEVAERFEVIDKQILLLIEEQWNLVNPTPQEIEDIIDCNELNSNDFIADPTVPLGKWFLAGETWEYRKMLEESNSD